MTSGNPWVDYLADASQRSLLFLDTLRERGNQFNDRPNQPIPSVLNYEYEEVMRGEDLSRPTNFRLLRIIPQNGTKLDPEKRPIVIIDPRAGHGPGISGFKADSEVGVSLANGHACYVVAFMPDPVEGQTIEDVMLSQEAFIDHVSSLHPKVDRKPVVVGNCQGGWALMMAAAHKPDMCGTIIVAGSPLSYWAGVHGKNPMRYSGGMLGGTWLTRLTSDLGAGTFDGAWLVSNFEGMNPANTLWTKQYNLYSKVDTEAERYLQFERYWGGYSILNGEEMQFIVDNLFVGNTLPTGGVTMSDGVTIDYRKIKSPILCFCSWGDNITPPQQALDWILDLYEDVSDIRATGQTIVYCIHENVGHLGIFVSGRVSRKEHREFATNLDFIDVLPPGLYEAVLDQIDETTPDAELSATNYVASFEPRSLDDIRALGVNSEEDERRFATVQRMSEITNATYRTFAQPWMQMMATPETAKRLQELHPARLVYRMFSDENPFMAPVQVAADRARASRVSLGPDNPFWKMQEVSSQAIISALEQYQDVRDGMIEYAFLETFGNPALQAALGVTADTGPQRPMPGTLPEFRDYVAEQVDKLKAAIPKGGPREAFVRGIIYIAMPGGRADERRFAVVRDIMSAEGVGIAEIKPVIRDQYFMLALDPESAISALPNLVPDVAQRAAICAALRKTAETAGPLVGDRKTRLEEIESILIPDEADVS